MNENAHVFAHVVYVDNVGALDVARAETTIQSFLETGVTNWKHRQRGSHLALQKVVKSVVEKRIVPEYPWTRKISRQRKEARQQHQQASTQKSECIRTEISSRQQCCFVVDLTRASLVAALSQSEHDVCSLCSKLNHYFKTPTTNNQWWWDRPLWAWSLQERLLSHGALLALDLVKQLSGNVKIVVSNVKDNINSLLVLENRNRQFFFWIAAPKLLLKDEESIMGSDCYEETDEESSPFTDENIGIEPNNGIDMCDPLRTTDNHDRNELNAQEAEIVQRKQFEVTGKGNSPVIKSKKTVFNPYLQSKQRPGIENVVSCHMPPTNSKPEKDTKDDQSTLLPTEAIEIITQTGQQEEEIAATRKQSEDCVQPVEATNSIIENDRMNGVDTSSTEASNRDANIKSSQQVNGQGGYHEVVKSIASKGDEAVSPTKTTNVVTTTQTSDVVDWENILVTPSPPKPKPSQIDSQGVDLTMLSQLPPNLRSEARLAMAVQERRLKRNRPNSDSRLYKWLSTTKEPRQASTRTTLPLTVPQRNSVERPVAKKPKRNIQHFFGASKD